MGCFSLLDLIFLWYFFQIFYSRSFLVDRRYMRWPWKVTHRMVQSTFLYAFTSFHLFPFSAPVCRILTAGKCCFPRKTRCWWRKKSSASPSEFLLMVSLHLVCFFKYSGELSLSDTDVHRSSLARWLWTDINSCRVQKCKQIWNGVADTWFFLKSVGQDLSCFALISVVQLFGMEVICLH